MKRKLILLGIIIGFLVIPFFLVSASPPKFEIATYNSVHYTEPTEYTTGINHHLVLNNSISNLGFNWDCLIWEYGRLTIIVQEVKNIGESLEFFLLSIADKNATHLKTIPLVYYSFVSAESIIFDVYNYRVFPQSLDAFSYIWIPINTYNLGDVIVYQEVIGTVTFSDHLVSTITYYSYEMQIAESWIDDVTEFDSITDYFLCFLTLPLILMSSSEELTFWLGVGLLIIEIMFVVGTVYKFVEAWL